MDKARELADYLDRAERVIFIFPAPSASSKPISVIYAEKEQAAQTIRDLKAENKKQQAIVDAAYIKENCIEFFKWWWNQPGTNTEQGFDEWWALKEKK